MFYHRTTRRAARSILRAGFRDTIARYMIDRATSGVWLSDRPLDANEGAFGDTLLRLTLRIGRRDLQRYEWIEAGKGYREWQMPASLTNARCTSLAIFPQWREDRL